MNAISFSIPEKPKQINKSNKNETMYYFDLAKNESLLIKVARRL